MLASREDEPLSRRSIAGEVPGSSPRSAPDHTTYAVLAQCPACPTRSTPTTHAKPRSAPSTPATSSKTAAASGVTSSESAEKQSARLQVVLPATTPSMRASSSPRYRPPQDVAAVGARRDHRAAKPGVARCLQVSARAGYASTPSSWIIRRTISFLLPARRPSRRSADHPAPSAARSPRGEVERVVALLPSTYAS